MKYLIIAFSLLLSISVFSQTNNLKTDIDSAIFNSGLDSTLVNELLTKNTQLFERIDSLKDDPDFYDKTWNKLVKEISDSDSTIGYWLNSLNIDFKTFQSEDSTSASLGLSYNFSIERGKLYPKEFGKNGISCAFSSVGNIAFDKKVNPTDFIDTKLSFKLYQARGGVQLSLKPDTVHQRTLKLLPVLMSHSDIIELKESKEWKEFTNIFKLDNSFLYSLSLNGGFESNQDFSKYQYAFGSTFSFSVKSWEKGTWLSRLNILDYPFALTRRLTKTDDELSSTGISLPIISTGIDYVIPENDTLREEFDNNLNPYFRYRLEIGFRTLVAKAVKQIIYFNAAFKYYNEIGASSTIKEASLSNYSYFTSSLTSDKGFFISYSYGRLPFDKQDNAVYQIGFNYKFK
ncbi:hypothetical protein KDU71_03810 [Carboxylicivirga sediminis]|uniref:DUF3078 domain-containing protein n=1 Tax=Carboxylicivirga sediminis TaxID=2006564 RepID=A0A941IWL3_9BACT|nr:hypothetical protein [Carboxylicivirga sediminis]MBR8534673.1 hypothetical protein [Carboxylicivirga sediminis]